MKIEPSVKSVGTSRGDAANRTSKADTSKAGPAPVTQVDVSPAATQLQQLAGASGNSPTFDVQKVAEIRQAIAEGRFQINAERIADGLISSVREMLANQDKPA